MTSLVSIAVITASLALLSMGGGSGRSEGVSRPAASCSSYTSRLLTTADSFVAYVEGPQLLRLSTGPLLVGSPSFAAKSNGTVYRGAGPSFPGLLAGFRIKGDGFAEPVPMPTAERLGRPRLIADTTGAAHLLWVDADSAYDPIGGLPIRAARWLGGRWSDPQTLAGTEGLEIWRGTSISPPVRVNGSVMVVATQILPSQTRALTLARGRWNAFPMPGLHQIYPSLNASGDSMVAVYVGYGEPDGNTLYASRSLDGGVTFGTGVRVGAPGSGAAIDPVVLRIGARRLVAVWIAKQGGSQAELLAAFSDDGGRQWRDGGSYKPGTGIIAMRATVMTTGKVVAIAQVGQNSWRLVPMYLEWRDGAWSPPLPLIRDSSSSLGVPAIAAGDSVTMAWGEISRETRRPVTRYVTLPADCTLPAPGSR